MTALVSACGTLATSTASASAPTPAPGKVSGFAQLCSGLPYGELRPSPPPMMVYVQQHGTAIARQKLSAVGGVYQFSLPPGSYVINAPNSGDPPQRITLHSEEMLTVNFYNYCK